MKFENGQNGQYRQNGHDVPGKAIRSEEAGRIYGRHSGYRKLLAYQVAEMLYDRLCERLLDRQARDFEAGGGFAERLHRARTARRLK